MQENEKQEIQRSVASAVTRSIGSFGLNTSKRVAGEAKDNAMAFGKSLVMDNPISQFIAGIKNTSGGIIGKFSDTYKEQRYGKNEGKEEKDAIAQTKNTQKTAASIERMESIDENDSILFEAMAGSLSSILDVLAKQTIEQENISKLMLPRIPEQGNENENLPKRTKSKKEALRLRNDENLSIRNIAKKIGYSKSHVQRWIAAAALDESDAQKESSIILPQILDQGKKNEAVEKAQNQILQVQTMLSEREDARREREMEWAERDRVDKDRLNQESLGIQDERLQIEDDSDADFDDEDKKKRKRRGGGAPVILGGGGIGKRLLQILKNVFNPKNLMGKGGLFGIAIAAIGIGIWKSIKDGGFDGFIEGLGKLKDAVFSVFDSLSPLGDMFMTILSGLKPIGDAIGSVLGDVFNSLAVVFTNMKPVIQGFLDALQPAIPYIKTIVEILAGIVGVGLKALLTPLKWAIDFVAKIWEGINVLISDPSQFFGWLLESLESLPGYLWDSIKGLFDSFPFAEKLGDIFTGIWEKLTTWLSELPMVGHLFGGEKEQTEEEKAREDIQKATDEKVKQAQENENLTENEKESAINKAKEEGKQLQVEQIDLAKQKKIDEVNLNEELSERQKADQIKRAETDADSEKKKMKGREIREAAWSWLKDNNEKQAERVQIQKEEKEREDAEKAQRKEEREEKLKNEREAVWSWLKGNIVTPLKEMHEENVERQEEELAVKNREKSSPESLKESLKNMADKEMTPSEELATKANAAVLNKTEEKAQAVLETTTEIDKKTKALMASEATLEAAKAVGQTGMGGSPQANIVNAPTSTSVSHTSMDRSTHIHKSDPDKKSTWG